MHVRVDKGAREDVLWTHESRSSESQHVAWSLGFAKLFQPMRSKGGMKYEDHEGAVHHRSNAEAWI